MKQVNRFILLLTFILFYQYSHSQQTVILHISQALEINAGSDITIDQFDPVTLGGSPTAQFGMPPYQYIFGRWEMMLMMMMIMIMMMIMMMVMMMGGINLID